MLYRAYLGPAILTLAWSLLLAGQQAGRLAPESAAPGEVVTMANMRALVPSLMEAGWDNFFLNWKDAIGLSAGQVQELLALRSASFEALAQAGERVRQAESALYEEMSQDQVSARQLEAQFQSLAVRRSRLAALKSQYLLRAINVLNHDQHQKLVILLRSLLAPSLKGESEEPRGLLHPDPPSRVVPPLTFVQYSEHPADARAKAQSDQCSLQPTISMAALQSYEPARQAINGIIGAADQLRKLAEAGLPANAEIAGKLLAQVQPELWLLQEASRNFQPLLARNREPGSSLLELQLRTEPLAEVMTHAGQQLDRESPNAAAVARVAEELKDAAKHWRKTLERTGEALCLSRPFRSVPWQAQADDQNMLLRRKGTQAWRPF